MANIDPQEAVVEFDSEHIDIEELLRTFPNADAPVIRCAGAAMTELHRLAHDRPPPFPEAIVALDLAIDALCELLMLSLGAQSTNPSVRLKQLLRISGARTVLGGWCSQDALDAVTRSNQVIAHVLNITLTACARRYVEHLRTARRTLGPRSPRAVRRQSEDVRLANAVVLDAATRITAFLGHPARARSKAVLDAVREALTAYRRYGFRNNEKRATGSKWNYVARLVRVAADIDVTGFALRQSESDHQERITQGGRVRERRKTK
jgi:hypothetical protein